MKKQIALNVFYTLGIIASFLGLKWGYEQNNYFALGLFAITIVFFIYLKIKLTKDFRQSLRDKANQP
ncbi:hypothetical protein AAKU52_000427 [Pedobacter sp. CG_S7]|uniref:DUF6358 family protein n=1 Tax=Pedobacter sp. CG_S7 TaxID=3143930 RepID=UPI003390E1DD